MVTTTSVSPVTGIETLILELFRVPFISNFIPYVRLKRDVTWPPAIGQRRVRRQHGMNVS